MNTLLHYWVEIDGAVHIAVQNDDNTWTSVEKTYQSDDVIILSPVSPYSSDLTVLLELYNAQQATDALKQDLYYDVKKYFNDAGLTSVFFKIEVADSRYTLKAVDKHSEIIIKYALTHQLD